MNLRGINTLKLTSANKTLNNMIKKLILLLLLVISVSNLMAQPKREVRAVWMTTNYGLDWPRNKYWGTADRDFMKLMLDKLQDANINTIIFQVQCLGDVFWESKIQPWSKIATGKYGQTPKYNICDFVVEECHKRGMEVHAWIVPYRLGTQANADGYNDAASNLRHVINTNPELCIQADDQSWYLDPGLPAVKTYLLNLYEELISTTKFDGINLDYCRYPDGKIDDSKTYAENNPNGLSKDDWRRENINQFVYELYDMIKNLRPDMKLGTAPFGTYKNAPGYGNTTAFGDVFQDAAKWMQQEKHDLMIPQMYWTEDYGFSPQMDVWFDNCNSRQLVIGLANYKMADWNKWQHTIITDQIEKSREKGAQGVCFFRTDNVVGAGSSFSNAEVEKLYNALVDNYFKYPAHIPTMDYNGVTKPNSPKNVTYTNKGNNVYEIVWNAPELDSNNTPIKYYTVYAQKGSSVDIADVKNTIGFYITDNKFTYTAPDNDNYTFAVTTFDNGYYESDASVAANGAGVATPEVAIDTFVIENGVLRIGSSNEISEISLYNVNGQLSKTNEVASCDVQINIESLVKGIYMVQIKFSNNLCVTRKIVI